MAERSKALVLGTSLFGGVGSNPTPINEFFLSVCTVLSSHAAHDTKQMPAAQKRFDSRLAQLVERKTLNLVVEGSSPSVGSYLL